MAENIVLSVKLSGAEAVIPKLTEIDNLVSHIRENEKIKIKVSAPGLTKAAKNAETLAKNLKDASAQTTNIGNQGAKNIDNAGNAAKKASKNAESFNNGLGNVVLTMAKFRLASSAINLVANGFKEAFKEMKAVDSEMVNIRKVTGFAADEIKSLSKDAFALATKYGRSASEVLTGETVFARAGYTTQIEQLGELSLLLQNVGDLQADDAAKFVIATDKAYKLGGSYEELMKVIDGLDNITNQNATDMQKMTEGMTIAGSVFAESGESIEMFAAMLGTATANTQRSGSEMARGLRTILMNIRQIRGETEDGELIDGESIAAASKALKDYANVSTMENGQIRKASDVLAELAGKWDTLTETQKAAVAEGVAGKRQANVLMALMADWESVTTMMQQYENAAGTAAQENAMYMDSWAAKTEVLKSSWNELIATMTDTDNVKAALDGLTSLIQGATKIAKENGIDFVSIIHDLSWAGQTSDLLGLTGSDSAKTEMTFSELRRYDDLIARQNALTWAEQEELKVLQAKVDAREKEAKAAEDAARAASASQNINSLAQGLADARYSFSVNKDAGELVKNLQAVVAAGQDYYDALQSMKNAGQEWTDSEARFVRSFDVTKKALDESTSAAEAYGFTSAASSLAAGDDYETAAQKANLAVDQINAAVGTLPETVGIQIQVTGVPEALASIGSINAALGNGGGTTSASVNPMNPRGYASGVSGAPGGPALVNERGPELISADGLAWIAGGGKPTVTMLPRGATVLTAQQTRNAVGTIPAFDGGTGGSASIIGTSREFTVTDLMTPKGSMGKYNPKYCPVCGTPNPQSAKRCIACGYNFEAAADREENGGGQGKYWGGADSGPLPPNFKALEDELSKRLKNLDAQAELAENQEDFLKAMQIYGDAQKYISELLDLYRENGYAEDSDEVLKLANLGYDYASKQLGGYDDLQKRLIDALNALTDATEDANALTERQEAVDKAREALANAERQRTVRIFNPVTGQWEWVANAGDVEKARESLRNAEQALEKEQLDQTISAIKNAKPEDLAGLTLSPAILDKLFNGTPEQQTAFLNALNAATGGADYLGSTAAQTAFNQGNTIGTQYNLNGIELTQEMAAGMSIKQLLDMLRGLQLM